MSQPRSTPQPLRPGRMDLVPVTGPDRTVTLPNQINGTRGIGRWWTVIVLLKGRATGRHEPSSKPIRTNRTFRPDKVFRSQSSRPTCVTRRSNKRVYLTLVVAVPRERQERLVDRQTQNEFKPEFFTQRLRRSLYNVGRGASTTTNNGLLSRVRCGNREQRERERENFRTRFLHNGPSPYYNIQKKKKREKYVIKQLGFLTVTVHGSQQVFDERSSRLNFSIRYGSLGCRTITVVDFKRRFG